MENQNNTVTIILTNIEAEKWKEFQKNYELFTVMQDKGVFKIEFGKVILNIAYGNVQNMVVESMVWKNKDLTTRENQ